MSSHPNAITAVQSDGYKLALPTALLDDDFLGVMDGPVMSGVPAVLGFRWPASDQGARILAQGFYSAWLDEQQSLDAALLQARQDVADQRGRDKWDWFSPVLILQAPDLP